MAKAKSGKKSLKDALLNHQLRLQRNKQTKDAIQRQQEKNPSHIADAKKAKGKAKEINSTRQSTIPFTPTDTILLIGEGNFSFALSLFKHPSLPYLPPINVTATAYDSEEACYEKYPEAKNIVAELREKGVELLFEIDAMALEKIKKFKDRKWDRIVWNFPHGGNGITDQDRNILANQKLLLGFLRSAASFLTIGPPPFLPGSKKKRKRAKSDDDDDEISDEDGNGLIKDQRFRGTVLVTLRNVHPYTEWDLPNLAKRPPPPTSTFAKTNPQYVQFRSFAFHRSYWPGYEHRMTKGERAHGTGTTGVGGEDRTWEFYLKEP